MTEHDILAASEAGSGTQVSGGKPSLFDRLRGLFGLGGASIRDDIADTLADTSIEDDVSPQERALLKNVLALHEVHVGDVMVPRADIVAVDLQTKLADVLEIFRHAGHSRLPVHGETLDDPRGMVHIRDFVAHLAVNANPPSAEPEGEAAASCRWPRRGLEMSLSQANILRPVLFVPASMPALDLLVKMQATRTHMALVIDEYGGTEGLASIEDIMEVIVGDIEDEHDSGESPKIEAAADGNFIVDARAGLSEVSRAIDADLTAISDAEEVDTLGGLVTALAGHVPTRGEIVAEDGIEFEVVDADPRRVKRVKIRMAGVRPLLRQIAESPAPGELAKQGGPHEKGSG
ncbi:MAG: hemolysin family protein [Pseudomonadota bacterium]|nr:hemolysin family protein [Pseudomonadota bacterium]